MATGLLVLHIVIASAMIGIILLQRNEGGGLGMNSSNMGGFMTTRGTANLLTRTTGILAASFFVTTIVLALIFKGSHNTQSILDGDDTVIVDRNISAPADIDLNKTNDPLTVEESQELEDPLVEKIEANEAKPVKNDVKKTVNSKIVSQKAEINDKSVATENKTNSVKK